MNTVQPDLALYDRQSQLIAVVEVMNRPGRSRSWAAQFRRNLVTFAAPRRVPFFLLVTPDRLFLWKDGADSEHDAEPDEEIEIGSFLHPYLERAEIVSEGQVPGLVFELAVGSWLADLMRSDDRGGDPAARERLRVSGFLDAVRDGRVEYPIAA